MHVCSTVVTLERCVNVFSSVACQLSDHYFGFPWWHCSREREGDFSTQNDKAGYRNGTLSSFLTSPGSACCILIALYVSRVSEETAYYLLAFENGIGSLHMVLWFGAPLGTRYAHPYFELMIIWKQIGTHVASYSLMVVSYQRGLPGAIFQHGNICCTSFSDPSWYTVYFTAAFTYTVCKSITYWKHIVMDCRETCTPSLSS